MVNRSVKMLCAIYFFMGTVFSQSSVNNIKDEPTPCQTPVLLKAQTRGLNSLEPVEILEYWVRSWQCKRYAKRSGQEIDLGYLQKQKQEEYYREAKDLSGLGSCFTTVIIITVLYSYISFTLVN